MSVVAAVINLVGKEGAPLAVGPDDVLALQVVMTMADGTTTTVNVGLSAANACRIAEGLVDAVRHHATP